MKMFQFIPIALLFQLTTAAPKGQVCVDDKQLELKSQKYNPDLSMLAYWGGNFSTVSSINELDTKHNCLVSFTQEKLDSCKQGAWMCIWQKKHGDGKVGKNTKVIEPGWPNDKPSHCHGGGWGKKDESDVTWKFRYENFNHVVCKDHGFTRGYHTGVTKPDGSYHWSCGCVEDMPLVTTCDCTQPNESSPNKYVNKACPKNDLAMFVLKKTGTSPSNPNQQKVKKIPLGILRNKKKQHTKSILGSFHDKPIPPGPMEAPVNNKHQCGLSPDKVETEAQPEATAGSSQVEEYEEVAPQTSEEPKVETEVKPEAQPEATAVPSQVKEYEEVAPQTSEEPKVETEVKPEAQPEATAVPSQVEEDCEEDEEVAPVTNVTTSAPIVNPDNTTVNGDDFVSVNSALQYSFISAWLILGSFVF